MEHIVAKHIRTFLDSNDILVDQQHGFRSHRSCDSQLLTTFHDIASSLDQKSGVDAVILDFSKAFDKVSHPKLLSKLSFYNMDPEIIQWTASWLSIEHNVLLLMIVSQVQFLLPQVSRRAACSAHFCF
jgi:hypothetical protein